MTEGTRRRRREIPPLPKLRPGDRFLTVNEVAELLRVTRTTVYRNHDLGELPSAYQIGLQLLWLEREFLAFLDGKRQGFGVPVDLSDEEDSK